MRTIVIFAMLSFTAATAQTQEVTPVFAEGKAGKFVKGQYTVINKGVTNLPVIIEPKQLVMVDGKPTFGPLQPGTEVELKDTSAVISPKSSRTFDYRLRCTQDCLVMFLNGMTTGKTKEGVMIRLWIPSSVFICTDSAKGCRVKIKTEAGLQ